MNHKMKQPVDLARRSFVATLGLTSSGAVSAGGLVGKYYANEAVQDSYSDALELMVLRKVRDAQANILKAIHTEGKDVQDLTEQQLAIIRRDVSSLFPTHASQQVMESAKKMADVPFLADGHAFVSISETGVITAYRRVGTEWERAGWSAPEGSEIKTERQAFKNAQKPENAERDKFITPATPNRVQRI
jgi:hypothetical protein